MTKINTFFVIKNKNKEIDSYSNGIGFTENSVNKRRALSHWVKQIQRDRCVYCLRAHKPVHCIAKLFDCPTLKSRPVLEPYIRRIWQIMADIEGSRAVVTIDLWLNFLLGSTHLRDGLEIDRKENNLAWCLIAQHCMTVQWQECLPFNKEDKRLFPRQILPTRQPWNKMSKSNSCKIDRVAVSWSLPSS